MYCPLLCIHPNNNTAFFAQCLEDACAWWITIDGTGKCAICQLGVYAGKQPTV